MSKVYSLTWAIKVLCGPKEYGFVAIFVWNKVLILTILVWNYDMVFAHKGTDHAAGLKWRIDFKSHAGLIKYQIFGQVWNRV